jgi:hypothetical protein
LEIGGQFFRLPGFISCFQLLLVAALQVAPQILLEFEHLLLDPGDFESRRPEPVLEINPALAVASRARVPGVLAAAGLVAGGGVGAAHGSSPLDWCFVRFWGQKNRLLLSSRLFRTANLWSASCLFFFVLCYVSSLCFLVLKEVYHT